MVAMVLIGMANLIWMIVLAAVVLVYKLWPAPTPPSIAASSRVVGRLRGLYAVAA